MHSLALLGSPKARACTQDMQPQRVGPRAGMGPDYPVYCQHRPDSPIRDPEKKLHQKQFYFHFENLCYANKRNNTFLCFKVKRMKNGSLPVLQGIFGTKDKCHAELRFLSWFHQILKESPGEEYEITWYMSWSPCKDCADKVARFLAAHHNLSLVIYISRLYYFWYPHTRWKLRRLSQEGANLAAMSIQEFKKCWDKFVDNDGKPFQPWWNLGRYFSHQDSNLKKILRFPLIQLREDVFHLQFNNRHRVKPVQNCYYRRKTYLCFQLEWNGLEPLTGCLQGKENKHAELLFIDEMCSMKMGKVQITCYLTWSPCPQCAQELARFKEHHPDVHLRIYTSRLYFHWKKAFQEGLCSLWRSKVQLDVMDFPQFTDCWTNFVTLQRPFMPWDGLEKNSRRIQRRLQRIKASWACKIYE